MCVCVRMCACTWRSVMSNSCNSHGLQSTRPLCPWHYPGKNTGVGCHFLLQGTFLTQGLNLHSPLSNLCYCKSGCKKYPYVLSHVCIPYMLTYVYVISHMCKHICRLIHWKWSCCQRVCAFDMLVAVTKLPSSKTVLVHTLITAHQDMFPQYSLLNFFHAVFVFKIMVMNTLSESCLFKRWHHTAVCLLVNEETNDEGLIRFYSWLLSWVHSLHLCLVLGSRARKICDLIPVPRQLTV